MDWLQHDWDVSGIVLGLQQISEDLIKLDFLEIVKLKSFLLDVRNEKLEKVGEFLPVGIIQVQINNFSVGAFYYL